MLMLFISVGLLGWLSYTKKVWSRFVYSKRGSDKTREKINGNNPHTRIDCVMHTKPNTDDGAVVYPFSH